MTRKIKAQGVKPGMEIEYEHGGWTFRVVVGGCEESHGDVWVSSVVGVGRFLENGQKVTVLQEAQPEEPTKFGTRVVVDGVQFIRRGGGSTYAWEASFGTCFTWDDLLRLGHVAVVPDQGWTVPAGSEATPEVHVATEPRTWDRWADVPEMTQVRVSVFAPPYRKVGGRIECKPVSAWEPSVTDEYELNKYSPFTEVLPGA